MAYHHHHNNNLSQELAFHRLSDHHQQHLDNNASSLTPCTSILSDHHRNHRPFPSSPGSDKKHQSDHPPPHGAGPNWLSNAILRQQNHYPDANFLNLHTLPDSVAATSNNWLPRSAGTDEDAPVSTNSIIPSATVPTSQNSNGDHNNRMSILSQQVNKVNGSAEAEIEGRNDDVMNWQNAKQKAEILAHPMYDQLLSAHVACLRIATPVDQLPRIDAQLAQSHTVVAKYASLGQANQSSLVGDDKELEQFMTHYFLLLCSFKEQLQQHVRVHAMEAVMACWETEQSLQSITGVCAGEGNGATMSDDDDDDEQVESDMNVLDGESMGFGPLIPTESERSLMERVRQELKHELKQGYKEKIVDIREEILRKRRAGKLPGDTTSVLKNWWQSHSKWPYPTEEDKARLVQQTGLQLKQINNWFINQRKRNWNSNPSSSSSSSAAAKSKRKSAGETSDDRFM